MKKQLVYLTATISALAPAYGFETERENHFTGHTFFTVRPQFQTATPERVTFFRNHIIERCHEGYGGAFQVVVFGSKSTHAHGLARYFLPGGCASTGLRVIEYNPNDSRSRLDGLRDNDVEARHFNIQTVDESFQSVVRFCPRQETVGVGFDYIHRLSCYPNGHTKFWGEISAPVIRVRNTMGLREDVIDDGGGAAPVTGLDDSPRVGNMRQAFRQRNWRYGRIVGCSQRTRLADIELKLGYNSINTDCSWLSSYLGIVIPTGNKPDGRRVFEAISGNGKHFGFFFGNSIGFNVLNWDHTHVTMRLDSNNRYLFENRQFRTFDTFGKPWGRYMEVYANQDASLAAADTTLPLEERQNAGTSGINVFTRCVKVVPRFSLDLNGGFILEHQLNCGDLLIEGGVNFFARQTEHIRYCRDINSIAFKSIKGEGRTSYARTIRDNFPAADILPDNYAAQPECNLDLNSGAHPATLSHTYYIAFAYRRSPVCPSIIGIGGSYEASEFNTALRRWTIWGKYAVTF